MKIECIKNNLENAVNKAEKISSKNTTLPILENILISTLNKNSITIQSTNLELGIEITVPAKVSEEGTISVSSKILQNFLSKIYDNDSVVLETKDQLLSVITKNTKTNLHTISHEEFPTLPKISTENPIKIPTQDFINGLKSVFYSTTLSSMKPALSSVFITPSNTGITFAATDSFRLSEKKISVKKHVNFEPILIPAKNTPEIIRAFEDDKGEIELHVGENQLSIINSQTHLTSRIVDATFPDYEQIIPKEFSTEVVVLKQDFLNCLKLVNIFTDRFNKITITLSPKNEVFSLKTLNKDVGETEANIKTKPKGEDIQMNFNFRYVIDCLQSITTDSVRLRLSEGKPMLIDGVGDNSFLYLVMSMTK